MLQNSKNNHRVQLWNPYTLDLMEKSGNGSYGAVYKVSLNENEFVVKKNYVSKKTSFIASLKELDILVRMRDHPFVVNLISITFESPIRTNMIEEVSKYRVDDLHFIFENAAYDGHTLIYGGVTSYTYLKMAMCQILLALEYMHARKIIHRDLKPNNLLWFRYGNDRCIKICDFGLSKPYTKQDTSTNRAVTIWYRAPEIIFGNENYTEKIDIWSAGCVFYEMISKKILTNQNGKNNVIVIEPSAPILAHKIISTLPENITNESLDKLGGDGSVKFDMKYFKNRPTWDSLLGLTDNQKINFNSDIYGKYDQFIDLLKKCCAFNPENRYSATDALKHSFFLPFRSYINSVRDKYRVEINKDENIDPKHIKPCIIKTIERKWAFELLKNIHGKSSKYCLYNSRMAFFIISMFDRYLHYLYTHNYYNKSLENETIERGPFHTRYETELRIVGCYYMVLKYFNTMNEISAYEDFVADQFKIPEAIRTIKEFEKLMITTILNYHIYVPSLYETADCYNVKLSEENVLELIDFYNSDNIDTNKTLYENFSTFISLIKSNITYMASENINTVKINPNNIQIPKYPATNNNVTNNNVKNNNVKNNNVKNNNVTNNNVKNNNVKNNNYVSAIHNPTYVSTGMIPHTSRYAPGHIGLQTGQIMHLNTRLSTKITVHP